MYRFAYNISLSHVILITILFCLLWFVTKKFLFVKKKVLWKILVLLFICSFIIILLYVALCRESVFIEKQWPEPFWSYKLVIRDHNYDYFQEIYLNILIFFFISFCCTEFFNTKNKIVMLVVLLLGFSFFIEWMQYTYNLGLAEFDDMVSNFLGSILGISTNRYLGGKMDV